jgi:hypothetical protein
MKPVKFVGLMLLVPFAFATGCTKTPPPPAAGTGVAKHEHHPPHGGTPVVLGDEVYHVELVHDAAAGNLQAYILDGELENFIRASAPSFEIAATVNGETQTLVLQAVPNPATGETIGDTSLFAAHADWLKTTPTFDATLKNLTIRGTTFSEVKFNFPLGNDRD